MLVALGMIVDEAGFAKHSELFPGNQYEAETLAGMVRSLEEHLEPGSDYTIVKLPRKAATCSGPIAWILGIKKSGTSTPCWDR